MTRRKPYILVAILIGAILSGCGPSIAELNRTPTQMVVDISASQTAKTPKITSTLTTTPTSMATATVTPTPTRLPTTTATSETAPLLPVAAVDPASQPPPVGYKTYNSPYWLALYYPKDWVQVFDEIPGDILLATESYGIYSGKEAEAAFQIFPAEQGDLETILDEVVSQLLGNDTEAKVLEKPHSMEVNGQSAVSAMVSLPRNEASVKLEWITVVQGYDRSALVLADCPAERKDLFKPILDQMLNSLYLRMGPPDPVIGDRTTPPGYVSYTNDWEGFSLSYPQDRTAEMAGDTLFVSPPGEPWQEQPFGRLEVIVYDDLYNQLGYPGNKPDEILYWFITMVGYTSSTFHDAVLVTDVVETEREDQEIARALISGTVDGEPAVAVVTVVQYGRRAGLAIAYGRDLTDLSEVNRIIDTLVITNPVRTGSISLMPGQEYSGTLQNAQKVNFSFPCKAGVPLALILKIPENEADMKLFDASGSSISYASSMSSPDYRLEEPAVMLYEPQADGDCALTVLDRSNIETHSYTLKMVDAQPSSPALLETNESELVADGVDQIEFRADAGERLILAAHPIGDECVDLSMEIYNKQSQEREERFHSLSDSCEDRAQAYSFVSDHDGTYTLQIKEETGKPVAYRLYILRVD